MTDSNSALAYSQWPGHQHHRYGAGPGFPTEANRPVRVASKPIYTHTRESLSPTAVYNLARKHGVYARPGIPTLGVQNDASGKSFPFHCKIVCIIK